MHKYLLVVFLASTTFTFGQAYSTNPYSSSGLGEEGSLGEAAFAAVGGIKSVIIDSNLVNFYNPSSYAFLAKGQPLMSVNIAGRISKLSQGDMSQTNGIGNLSHIALAFPIGKNFGFAFGITPFSRKGYSLTTSSYVYDDSVRYQYRGVGTTQRVFTGLSYKLINTDRTQFAVGGNLSYIFGTVGNERYSAFEGVSTAGLDETVLRMKSIYYDLGAHARIYMDSLKQHQLILGANFVPAQTLTATQDYALYTTIGSTFNRDSISDTIVYNVDQKGSISYPSTFTLGGGYNFTPRNADGHLKYVYQLGIYAEFSRTTWSTYRENFSDHTNPSYKDATRLSLGVTYRPSIYNTSKAAGGGSFLNKIQYKAGYYTQSFAVQTAAGQLTESAVSLGFGIPMGIAGSNSAVNISVAGGNRTDGSDTGINEKFMNISVGIVLSPSKNDRWFRKFKLD